MTKLSYLIALILALGIIFINCERQPSQVEESLIQDPSQTKSLSKITVIFDENYKEDWAMLYCPLGNCDLPECVEVPCLQECLEVTGTMRVHQKYFIDANGGRHIQVHVNDAHVKGIGLETGTKYVCPNMVNTNFYHAGQPSSGDFPYKFHHKQDVRLISQGDAPNYQITYSRHFTINANGEITTSREVEEFKCE